MPRKEERELTLASLLIHADSLDNDEIPVGVPISVSTTFRHPRPADMEQESASMSKEAQARLSKPGQLHPGDGKIAYGLDTKEMPPFDPQNPDRHIYSRETQPVLTRVEKVLSKLLDGHALAYSSGLSAVFAALLFYQPTVIAIGHGYHGTDAAIEVYRRTRENVKLIDLDDDYTPYKDQSLLCWLETPVNPTGEARDMEKYEKKTHALPKGKLVVDSTFAPPPLQFPFEFGVDMVMHSGTKYFAGHSDTLIGILATKSIDDWTKLWGMRTAVGNVPGSLETWLLLRSLRTLQIRVARQSATATAFALWLEQVLVNAPDVGSSYDGCPGGVLKKVWHAALQGSDGAEGQGFSPLGGGATGDEATKKRAQMQGGPACFGILLHKESHARWLPHEMKLMVPATSLGGVESLIEQRLISDATADPCLIRLSIGLEDLEDLKEDFRRASAAVLGRSSSKL